MSPYWVATSNNHTPKSHTIYREPRYDMLMIIITLIVTVQSFSIVATHMLYVCV